MKGRQCMRCRLKNLKCSDAFPCTSCIEHWEKTTNKANGDRTMTWRHCFDARLEDLNVLVDLTHATMFARTQPIKPSDDRTSQFLTGTFKQICFITELAHNYGSYPSLQQCLESQYSGLVVCNKAQKGKSTTSPLSHLIHAMEKQLPGDTWTLAPTRSGKAHAIPNSSHAATELAIDLGTLYLLICYGPTRLQYTDIFDSTDAPRTTWPDTKEERSNQFSRIEADSLPTYKANKYIFDQLDRFLGPSSSESAGRTLPFKAATLPDRWAFLRDYLSHWVDKVRLNSTELSAVTSRLVLAQRLCCLRLLDSHGNYSTCDGPQPPQNSHKRKCPTKLGVPVDPMQAAAAQLDFPEGFRGASSFHGRQVCSKLAPDVAAMAK
ncbi:hypothetical protein PG988_013843 [Apiospora saccharicola]